MSQVVRSAITITPFFHRQLLHFISLQTPTTSHHRPLLSRHRHTHIQPQALRPPQELELEKNTFRNNIKIESDDEEDVEDNKKKKRRSRNEMKREARQAVRWGMDLVSFTTPQIKLILKAASLEEEVFEALMLVKRLGSDVREGKRRQFNYIGRLLRDADAQPDLLGALIQATKDGDQSRFQALAGLEKQVDQSPKELFNESESESESESEQEIEYSGEHVMLASKWFNGLIEKDIQTSNEVYSIDTVDFDRQELRKLVRKVHNLQNRQSGTEEIPVKSTELTAAEKSLNRFLCSLAKQHSSSQLVDV
ncbi:uncharacterized protein LOC130798966 [Amaranthus tricolor]|uniref:uncharacterized protein LOC130798966 n=1 Tax=Amaranthus tricolor TaxID=29722 RepID=UPI00258D5099|nr:uncharacterized protein LOC130798966 [Amaranthus tricolor]